MHTTLLFLFIFGAHWQGVTEKYPFSKWEPAVLEQANTAAGAHYMSEQEQQVIFLCNLARLNGKLFAETWVKKFYDEHNVKRTSYSNSLISDLKKVKGLGVLQPAEDLYYAAREHAVSSGKKGTTGHQKFSSRIKKHAPGNNPYGENCSYGFNDALNIVMQLLIDEGISNKGHRKNILHKSYNRVGVSIQKHKKYNYNCVMDFGKK